MLKVGTTVYVGLGSRTNDDGIRQLTAIVEPLGYQVVTVPVTRVLHLKSAVTALPDGTVIGFPPLVDDPSVFPEFLAVPEAHGTAVVVLDDDTVLMSASAPQTARLLAERGLEVVIVPITEFEKLEGCVTCLSVRLRDDVDRDMSDKRDLKRELDQYQAKRGEFRLLEVPPTRYLMVDGHGGPDSAEYADALAALFPVAYGLKFASKRELGAGLRRHAARGAVVGG